jgi:hypothetical protein
MRSNFTTGVKRIVASRSGYQCSFPGCPALTIGPGRNPHSVSVTGVAAHIYSAAKMGPRGQGSLTPAELVSSANAIWLCETHAKLVDNNRGTNFPPAVLISYKGFHEAAISRRHAGIHAPLGWFHELRIIRGPVFKTPAKVRFGKLTILSGNNSTGKTALWQWLASVSDPARGLKRWKSRVRNDPAPWFEVTYFSPMENVVRVRISNTGKPAFRLNKTPVPFNPISTRFIVIQRIDRGDLEEHEKDAWENWSDLERISAALHIDIVELENILQHVGRPDRFIQRVWVDKATTGPDGLRGEVKVKLKSHGKFYPTFSSLSGGEQVDLLIEIGIALAGFSAQYVPTVLVLDAFRSLDAAGQKYWSSYLSEPEHLFQTIVEAHLDSALAGVFSPNWEVVTLEGRPPNVAIHQLGEGVDLRKKKL